MEIAGLAGPTLHEHGVCDGQRREALVDDPPEGADPGAPEVSLELGRLVHRRGLGQRDQQHPRGLRVAQAREEGAHRLGDLALAALDLAVIRLGRVEQQQRVAGGRGVDDDEPGLALVDDAGERLEHRDLLGAGRA